MFLAFSVLNSPPARKPQPYIDPSRNPRVRQEEMTGYACEQCTRFHAVTGNKLVCTHSKHRFRFKPTKSPPHFNSYGKPRSPETQPDRERKW